MYSNETHTQETSWKFLSSIVSKIGTTLKEKYLLPAFFPLRVVPTTFEGNSLLPFFFL